MDYEKRVHDAMREIVAAGLAESAHDLSDGGLAVALAECCTGRSRRGVAISNPTCGRNSRFSTKVRRAFWFRLQTPDAVERNRRCVTMSKALRIGVTMKERLRDRQSDAMLIDLSLSTV